MILSIHIEVLNVTLHMLGDQHYSLDWTVFWLNQSNWCHLFARSIWLGNSHHFADSHYYQSYTKHRKYELDENWLNLCIENFTFTCNNNKKCIFNVCPLSINELQPKNNSISEEEKIAFTALTRSLYFPAPFWMWLFFVIGHRNMKRKPINNSDGYFLRLLRLLWLL